MLLFRLRPAAAETEERRIELIDAVEHRPVMAAHDLESSEPVPGDEAPTLGMQALLAEYEELGNGEITIRSARHGSAAAVNLDRIQSKGLRITELERCEIAASEGPPLAPVTEDLPIHEIRGKPLLEAAFRGGPGSLARNEQIMFGEVPFDVDEAYDPGSLEPDGQSCSQRKVPRSPPIEWPTTVILSKPK